MELTKKQMLECELSYLYSEIVNASGDVWMEMAMRSDEIEEELEVIG